MGSLPAKSAMKSKVPCSRAGSRCSRAISRMWSSIWATLDGVKPLPTSERIRVWRGGSRARKDMNLWASGPKALGSSETPWALENPSTLRKAARTSSWRERAQKSSSSFRYTGASARSRA